ncbi:Arc family DNA-binding protein [Pseudomonas monteilii]|nr:Arc family DNA-binding protein [Pseudomonas monteilii]
MARKDPQFNLRLPEELKQWVEEQAAKNHRSQTAELVFLISEEKRKQEQAAA